MNDSLRFMQLRFFFERVKLFMHVKILDALAILLIFVVLIEIENFEKGILFY